MTTSSIKRRRSSRDGTASNDSDDQRQGATTMLKRDSEDDTWASSGYHYINPFVHNVQITSSIDMAKIYFLTVFLLPVRIVGCVLSLVSAWILACIGIYGLTVEDLKAKPISGWRKQIQTLAKCAMRLMYASGTFHHITIKGERASPKEAPILVVAPHSSFADSIIVVAAGPPSIVAKRDTSQIPLLGKIIDFAQPIYVQREDPNSRQNTIREIVDRARSPEDWPQVVIFVEGTCTNRTALIKFKPGAFYPGVAVQPVLLRYPNKYDTFTWTWDGPSVWRLIWMTMCQFYNHCEIEFLPVYKPSQAEIDDANLYAKNVREVMAKYVDKVIKIALQVPTSEYSFEDVIVMSRAKNMKVPFPGDIVEIERLLYSLGLLESNRALELTSEFLTLPNTDKLDLITFGEYLQVDLKNVHLHQLFSLLDHSHSGTVSLKTFLLCALFCKLINLDIIDFLRHIVPIYSDSCRYITRVNFCKILRHTGKLSADKIDALFFAIDETNTGFISFDDFEQHTKPLPQYKFLYTKQEHIRRQFLKAK